MLSRFDHSWRVLATGLAFLYVFLGGFVLAAVIFPIFALRLDHRHRQTRLVIHGLFQAYLWALQRGGLLRLELIGRDLLAAPGGRLIVANHPSLLDVVLLVALVPDAQCIVKHQLWTHRLLGPMMRQAGYIRNDLPATELVAACRAAFDDGSPLIIFPEGTRTLPGALPQFRRGFANIATLIQMPVQLIVISCDPPTLIKGEPWWRIPPRAPTFRLEVSERLDISSYLGYPYRSVGARRLVQSLESYYAEKLTHV